MNELKNPTKIQIYKRLRRMKNTIIDTAINKWRAFSRRDVNVLFIFFFQLRTLTVPVL